MDAGEEVLVERPAPHVARVRPACRDASRFYMM